MKRISDQPLDQLKAYVEIAEQDVRARIDPRLNVLVAHLRRYLTIAWQRDVTAEEGETAAIRLFAAAKLVVDRLSLTLATWLADAVPAPASEFLRYVMQQRQGPLPSVEPVSYPHDPSTIHLFERFLREIDPSQRRRVGVFYTPRPIVQYIVKQTHRLLQDEFHLPDGLADIAAGDPLDNGEDGQPRENDPSAGACPVQIFDPAIGTGVFLVESIDVIHQTLVERWRSSGQSELQIRRLWNRYVTAHLFPRLAGVDLMPAPCLLAAMNIALKLAGTGYEFDLPGRMNLHVADSLAGPLGNVSNGSLPGRWKIALEQSARSCQDSKQTVILGNPPYAALSNSNRPWIERLIRGRLPGDVATGSYYEIDGQPLKERKLWLHDDYVKFMRFGQWKIEQAGAGILALVTNHGYLDNPTFRGMRQQLANTFTSISLVDLHGNAKKRETSNDGRPDQNVFDVEQGIALGLFRRTPLRPATAEINYVDVWGKRPEKYAWLESRAQNCAAKPTGDARQLHPVAPFYFFVPRDHSLDHEYQRGTSLTDVFPVSASAVVTARDSFVIAFEKDELVQRLAAFRDLSIPDDEIRRRYFNNSRSRKYPPGDTRGWKLTDARRRLADDSRWQERIRGCLYRPFDKRYVYWSTDMIDWPRTNVTRHLLDANNLALVARRQMLPTQPCRYFWVTDDVTIDGVIRSDNRGNETVFPLYLFGAQPTVNLNSDIVRNVAERWNLNWIDFGRGDLQATLGPEAILQYIYALFHSGEYRRRFAPQLRVDFPRVFFPGSIGLFRFLTESGRRLIANHRTSQFSPPPAIRDTSGRWQWDRAATRLAGSFPRYEHGRVYLNASTWLDDVAADQWDFHAGGHQVLYKWLKDRRGRYLTEQEMCTYQNIVQAIGDTLKLVAGIDDQISRAGGWRRAFASDYS